MAARGRNHGYANYTVNDQLLLCSLVEKILPLGRNMWEQVAVQYNATRARGAMERDFESLRRKFKCLYTKPKPTGRGEVSARNRPAIWARRIQAMIEAEGGVHTAHDGQDQGEDDEELNAEVLNPVPTTGAPTVAAGSATRPLLRAGLRPLRRGEQGAVGGIHVGVDAGAGTGTGDRLIAEDESGDGEVAGGDAGSSGAAIESDQGQDLERYPVGLEAFNDLANLEGESVRSDDTVVVAGEAPTTVAPRTTAASDQPPDLTPRPITGVIMTSHGTIDTSIAHHSDFLNEDIASEEDSSPEPAEPLVAETSVTADHQTPPPRGSAVGCSRSQAASTETSARSQTSRIGAEPKKPKRKSGSRRTPLPTVATPDGPILHRDPEMASADTRELEEHSRLDIGSNRLGGEDLRVLRDNFETVAQAALNSNGKRTQSDKSDTPSNTTIYARSKRFRAKQRMDEMRRELDDLEAETSNEMMRLLLFFQKDGDRRAEAEERRRRAERDERLEIERRDRAERGQHRREEAEAAERRRAIELQEAREAREEQRRVEAERDAKAEHEKEKNRRIAEDRIALEREESRQRHEQMMLMLANLQTK